MRFPRAWILVAAFALCGCDRGLSACEQATRASLPATSQFEKIASREEPGETRAMTYYVIDYFVTVRDGKRREQVHCSYMRDTGRAVPHRISSQPAP